MRHCLCMSFRHHDGATGALLVHVQDQVQADRDQQGVQGVDAVDHVAVRRRQLQVQRLQVQQREAVPPRDGPHRRVEGAHPVIVEQSSALVYPRHTSGTARLYGGEGSAEMT